MDFTILGSQPNIIEEEEESKTDEPYSRPTIGKTKKPSMIEGLG